MQTECSWMQYVRIVLPQPYCFLHTPVIHVECAMKWISIASHRIYRHCVLYRMSTFQKSMRCCRAHKRCWIPWNGMEWNWYYSIMYVSMVQSILCILYELHLANVPASSCYAVHTADMYLEKPICSNANANEKAKALTHFGRTIHRRNQ